MGNERRLASAIAFGALIFLPLSAVAQQSLSAGDVLVYATPDGGEREWLVDTAESGLELGGRRGCHRIRFAPGGPSSGADERITCVSGDTLFRWSTASGQWNPSRPIGARDSLDLPSASGSIRYLTGEAAVDTISGAPVPVVFTTVLTIDSSGTAVRRLVERYAPGLGTATWGRFEVPEGDGWRGVQEFRLVAWRGSSR